MISNLCFDFPFSMCYNRLEGRYVMPFAKAKIDIAFKSIYCNENNYDLLTRLIKEVINDDVNIIALKVPELVKKNMLIKGKTLDILVKTDKGEINIEVNTYSNKALRRRNAGYIFKRYSDYVNVGKTYKDMPKFIQINLTSGDDEMPERSVYTLYDNENDKEYIDNLEIYEINIKKAKEAWYNEGRKVSLIGLLDCNLEELEKASGDELVEKFKDEIVRLNEDKEFMEYLTAEQEQEILINSFKNEGYEKGIEQGIEKGMEQEKINTARNMLKEIDDLDLISRITGLSIEIIEKLKQIN